MVLNIDNHSGRDTSLTSFLLTYRRLAPAFRWHLVSDLLSRVSLLLNIHPLALLRAWLLLFHSLRTFRLHNQSKSRLPSRPCPPGRHEHFSSTASPDSPAGPCPPGRCTFQLHSQSQPQLPSRLRLFRTTSQFPPRQSIKSWSS